MEAKKPPLPKRSNPSSSVRSLYSLILKGAVKDINDQKGVPPRVIFCIPGEEKTRMMVAPLDQCETSEARSSLMSFIAQKSKEKKLKVEASISVCEAWYSVIQKDVYESEGAVQPSQDPNKKEALMVAAEDDKGNCVENVYEIVRGKDGAKLVSLTGEFEDLGKWYLRNKSGIQNNLLTAFWSVYRS